MPAGSERAGEPVVEPTDLPVTFRPRGVRVAALVFGGLLLATVVVLWLSFPDDVRASFTTFQRLTVLVLGLMVLVIEHGLSRCRIDATAGGLHVVNGYRTHDYTWPEVVAVTLRPGNPWTVLDLSDGTSQAAMGIQGSDGARAKAQVRRLRALIEAHAADEPPRPGPAQPR
ncbi:PH domain-containing protein [Nocardioides sp. HDW12B]|uniref:PH domain-containing protein n=1 Tax=Nocardioides sp. HDW12B TaxID=2714939 RepID=UPI001409B81A|nr:PH domain-containing protein [Nocardioides sp. HDW12B]QIK66586.1 PH domain-containing protein [Nocardioides sp. HDW12B]